jgi:hypothetical protein
LGNNYERIRIIIMALQVNKTIMGIPVPTGYAKLLRVTTVVEPEHKHFIELHVFYNEAAKNAGEKPLEVITIPMPYDPTASASFNTLYQWVKAPYDEANADNPALSGPENQYFSGATDV